MKRKIEFDNGEVFSFNEVDLELSSDLQVDMTFAASRYAQVCHYHALAKRELERVDSHYRQWRAITTRDNPGQCSSEPKAKAYLESLPAFLDWKEKISKYQEVVDFLDGVKSAYDIKARLVIAKSRETSSVPSRSPTYSHVQDKAREYSERVRARGNV